MAVGSYDGAEVCKLVGIHLLFQLKQLSNQNIVLYRDDDLAIGIPRNTKNLKKQMCKIFKNNGLQITIEGNTNSINFLDVTLNHSAGTYRPYMKPGNTPLYIHTSSNHPPGIIKNIPLAVNKRLSSISSDAENFNKEIEPYQKALHRNGYTHQLKYQFENTTTRIKKTAKGISHDTIHHSIKQQRAINVERKFQNIIHNTFKASHFLKMIFNKN